MTKQLKQLVLILIVGISVISCKNEPAADLGLILGSSNAIWQNQIQKLLKDKVLTVKDTGLITSYNYSLKLDGTTIATFLQLNGSNKENINLLQYILWIEPDSLIVSPIGDTSIVNGKIAYNRLVNSLTRWYGLPSKGRDRTLTWSQDKFDIELAPELSLSPFPSEFIKVPPSLSFKVKDLKKNWVDAISKERRKLTPNDMFHVQLSRPVFESFPNGKVKISITYETLKRIDDDYRNIKALKLHIRYVNEFDEEIYSMLQNFSLPSPGLRPRASFHTYAYAGGREVLGEALLDYIPNDLRALKTYTGEVRGIATVKAAVFDDGEILKTE